MHAIVFFSGLAVVAGLILFTLGMLCRNEPDNKSKKSHEHLMGNWK